MRVAVDASPLLLRSAGVKNYLYHWITALREHSGHSVEPFPFLSDVGSLTHEQSVLGPASTLPRIAFLLASNYIRPALRMAVGNADLFHATNQVHHPVRGLPLTATIHDMTCWLMPELHTEANVKADTRFAEHILKRADALIAVSENTRQDAIRILGLKPEKVVTIHSGVPKAFFDATAGAVESLRQKYGLHKHFILHIGTIEPRKNIDALLDGYLLLPEELRSSVELVLAGPLGWAASTTAQRIQSGLPGVRYFGYVPEPDLPALTKAATVFAYPSLYEGFGFPVAQAMACQVAVVTSNNSCLPEISGDGALHVDPRSPAEISGSLQRLLTDRPLRERLARQGRARSERYRWETCAAESWNLFERFA